jgi:phosphoribosylglycinamide formyltransferase-1
MQAIAQNISDGHLDASIEIVISNKASAPGLEIAQGFGITTDVHSRKDYAGQDEQEAAIVAALQANNVDWVILAGYMRIIGPQLLEAFPDRILNIHPSLLPAYKGLDAQQQALDDGCFKRGFSYGGFLSNNWRDHEY